MKRTLFSLLLVSSLGSACFAAKPAIQSGSTWSAQASVQQLMTLSYFRPRVMRNFEEKERERAQPDLSHRKPNPLSPPNHKNPVTPHNYSGISPDLSDPAIQFATNANWNAVDLNSSNGWPPDSMGCVGPTNYLVMVNGRIRSFDLHGNLGPLDLDTDSFFASVLPPNYTTTDPRVKFDPFSGRWILVMDTYDFTNNKNDNPILVAYSDNASITASTVWTFFAFMDDSGATPVGDTNDFADYPTLGVDQNALYIGTNMFTTSSFVGTTEFVIPKSQLFNSKTTTPTVTAFREMGTSNGGIYTPQGADNFVLTSQGTGYIVGIDLANEGVLDLYPVNNPGTTPTLGSLQTINIPADTAPVSIKSPGTDSPIDSDDQRLLAAGIYLNKPFGQVSLWTSQHIGVTAQGNPSDSGTQDGARWYQINPFASGGATLMASGTLYDPQGTSFLYPTVAMTGQGHAVMGFTQIGPNLNPNAVVCRKLVSDTNFVTSATTASTGSVTYSGGLQNGVDRWGDYSFVSIAPYDDQTVWAIEEFVDQTDTWADQVTAVLAPPPPALASITPNVVARGYTGFFTVAGTQTANGQDFFRIAPQYANYAQDLKAFVNGQSFGAGLVTLTSIKFSTTGIPVGSYPVTVKNPDLQQSAGSVNLTVVPALTKLTFDKTSVVGGGSVNATLTLEQSANVTEPIALQSSSSSATVPSSEPVPASSSSVTFSIPTTSVTQNTTVTITANDPGSVHTITNSFTVLASNVLTVASVVPNKTTVTGGQTMPGTITLSAAAPSGGATVSVNTHSTAADFSSSTISVPAGSKTASFTLNSNLVGPNTKVTLNAGLNGVVTTGSITVLGPAISSVQFPNPTAICTNPISGTVNLTFAPPSSGVPVTLTSGNTNIATVPSTVLATAQSFNFTVTTKWVTAASYVTIAATANGATKSAQVRVNTAALIKFTVGHASVVGGNSDDAAATLNAYVPSGTAAQIVVKSGNTAVVQVTSPEPVPAGHYTVGFNFATSAVKVSTNVNIYASYGGTTLQATVTVTPPAALACNLGTNLFGMLEAGPPPSSAPEGADRPWSSVIALLQPAGLG